MGSNLRSLLANWLVRQTEACCWFQGSCNRFQHENYLICTFNETSTDRTRYISVFFFVPCSWILHLILKYQTRVLSRASFRFPVGSGGRPDNRCHECDDIDSRRAVRSLLWVAFVAVNHNFVSVFFNIRRPFFEVRAGYWTQIWKAKLNFAVIGLNPVAIDIPSVRLFKTSTISFSKKKSIL